MSTCRARCSMAPPLPPLSHDYTGPLQHAHREAIVYVETLHHSAHGVVVQAAVSEHAIDIAHK